MNTRQRNLNTIKGIQITDIMELDDALYFLEEGITTVEVAIEYLKDQLIASRISVEKLVLPDVFISWLIKQGIKTLGDLVSGGERLVRRFYYGMDRVNDGGDWAVRIVNEALFPYDLTLK